MLDNNSFERPLIETTFSELNARSGVFDETQSKELTNYEFIEEYARRLGAYSMYISYNGVLSKEAAENNSQVTRTGQGEYIVALVAKFPPT